MRNALAAAPEARTAVVHDAARPLVTRELVEACLGALMGVDGAIAAAPVTDTVKEAYPDGTVAAHARPLAPVGGADAPGVQGGCRCAGRWTSTTPPSRRPPTTPRWWRPPAARVRLVEAPAGNLKVTTEADLARAEAALC